jgi:polyisoprenoid-binding protein YceI
MFKLIVTALLALSLSATDLPLKSGFIQAHTEVFGDNAIDPATNKVSSNLRMEDSIESLKGTIQINALDLKSDKEKRDANMYELLQTTLHPTISFEIIKIVKNEANYTIVGNLTLNGVAKLISSEATISQRDEEINMFGQFAINLTSFGMEPPTMFFLTVRNQIDVMYNLHYAKGL